MVCSIKLELYSYVVQQQHRDSAVHLYLQSWISVFIQHWECTGTLGQKEKGAKGLRQ